MSFDALAWAAKCNPGSAPRKLVLLALAECASREANLAFPSLGAIAEFTSLNRKTIIAALDDLEAAKFISQTGEKRGRTGQIKVYHLNLETVPKTVLSRKRNSSVFSAKEYRKRDTEPVREPEPSIATQQMVAADEVVSIKDVFEGWNSVAKDCGLSQVKWPLSERRRTRLRVMLRQYPDAETWRGAFRTLRSSGFLQGKHGEWKADFEFFLQAKSFEKLIEGSYA